MGVETRRPQILVRYDLMERLTNEEEDLMFETKLELLSICTITFSKEMILLLNVGMSEIRSTEEFDPKQGTSNQTTIKLVLSIMKSEDFCVKPNVSLEDKVYP